MHHRNLPISVWHGQPFEVPVLNTVMRWALVKYANPQEVPRKFSVFKNLYIIREGQPFGAVGNIECTTMRTWQFRWWLGWPKSKRIELAVRKLSERRMPEVYTPTPEPRISAAVAMDIQRRVLSASHVQLTSISMPSMPTFNLQPFNLQLTSPADNPKLKGFDDEI